MSRDGSDLLNETVRVWDAQRSSVFVEGRVVACTDRPVIFVRTTCDCGREATVGHVLSLPIDVLSWLPRNIGQGNPQEDA